MKNKLTSTQANKLAENFLDIAKAIRFHIDENKLNMSVDEYNSLIKKREQILLYGEEMILLSVDLTMDDASESLKIINDITNEMKTTNKKIENVQNIIDIVDTVSDFAKAIISKDTKQISKSLGECIIAWNSTK